MSISKLKSVTQISLIIVGVLVLQSSELIVDPDGVYNIEWEASKENGTVTFELTVKTLGFIGLGISPNRTMDGADIIGVEIRDNGLNAELKVLL